MTSTSYNHSARPIQAPAAIRQTTLAAPIHCTGTGVHSGLPVTLRLLPAPADRGIVFRRVDLEPAVEIPALWDRVVDTKLCTVLGSADGAVTVGTVEHLMAALAGCQIDNLVIEIDGPELPIMDGSAEPFVFLIECAGVARLDAARKAIKVLRAIEVIDGDKRAILSPASDFSLDLEIEFAASVVGRQSRVTTLAPDAFKRDISRARTFGFLHEVDALRRIGLARGGSLENAVVIDGDTVMNEGGLRYADEFVRHKLLDAVGDLYLAGRPLLASFDATRCGHALNNQLLRALFANPDAWVEVEVTPAQASTATGGAPPLWHRRIAASAAL